MLSLEFNFGTSGSIWTFLNLVWALLGFETSTFSPWALINTEGDSCFASSMNWWSDFGESIRRLDGIFKVRRLPPLTVLFASFDSSLSKLANSVFSVWVPVIGFDTEISLESFLISIFT